MIDRIYKKTGPDEAIIGTLILSDLGKPRKKKVIFKKVPTKPTKKISKNLFFDKNCHFINAIGERIREAKKNLINARVNGGMFFRANLKIGEAAPQIVLAIIKAKIGFIVLVYQVLKVSSSSSLDKLEKLYNFPLFLFR